MIMSIFVRLIVLGLQPKLGIVLAVFGDMIVQRVHVSLLMDYS